MEYDKRFSVYQNFAFYDINEPLGNDIPKMEKNSFDFILADPPFWLEDVLNQLFKTIDYLKSKDAKVLICAGPPMTRDYRLLEEARNVGRTLTRI